MVQKLEDGAAQATAEDLEIVTPDEVPDVVTCYITKRQVRGVDARLVKYVGGRNEWVHKRFVGDTEVEQDDDDDVEERFPFETDLTEEAPPADDDDELDDEEQE